MDFSISDHCAWCKFEMVAAVTVKLLDEKESRKRWWSCHAIKENSRKVEMTNFLMYDFKNSYRNQMTAEFFNHFQIFLVSNNHVTQSKKIRARSRWRTFKNSHQKSSHKKRWLLNSLIILIEIMSHNQRKNLHKVESLEMTNFSIWFHEFLYKSDDEEFFKNFDQNPVTNNHVTQSKKIRAWFHKM